MSKLMNERLKKYLEAEESILNGQSYTIGNRTLTRANLATVERIIENLLAAGATTDDEDTASRGSMKRVVFFD